MTKRADRDLPPKQGQLFSSALELAYTRRQAGYHSGALLVSASAMAFNTFMVAYDQGRSMPRSKLESVHAAAARIVEKSSLEPRTHEEIDAYYSAQLAETAQTHEPSASAATATLPPFAQGENHA